MNAPDVSTTDPIARSARDRGQAAVEFALALPLVIVVVLGIVQVVVVARDQLAVEVAAREGARAAAVAGSPAAAAERAALQAISLRPLGVATNLSGTTVAVTVTVTNRTDVPIIGAVIGDVDLSATVSMAREPP